MTKVPNSSLILSGVAGQLLLVLALTPLVLQVPDYAPVGWSSLVAIPAAVWFGRWANQRFQSPKAACIAACLSAGVVSLAITSFFFLVWVVRVIDAS